MLLTYDNNEENMLGPHMENYTFALSPISLNKSNQQSKFIPVTIIQKYLQNKLHIHPTPFPIL